MEIGGLHLENEEKEEMMIDFQVTNKEEVIVGLLVENQDHLIEGQVIEVLENLEILLMVIVEGKILEGHFIGIIGVQEIETIRRDRSHHGGPNIKIRGLKGHIDPIMMADMKMNQNKWNKDESE